MKKQQIAFLGSFVLILQTACGNLQWQDGVPTDEQVKLNLKGNADSGQSLVGDESERAGFYELTWGVTRGFNVMTIELLALTRAIVQSPVSEQIDETHAVWGPSDPKGLERLQFKATGERLSDAEFEFVLLARAKTSTDEADYGEIYKLRYYRSGDELGHGSIEIDRDQHAAIDPQDQSICETGKAQITFANDGQDSMKIIDIDFSTLDRSACEVGDNAQMGTYHYAEALDGAGDFMFNAMGNIHQAHENKPAIETMTIRSQWTAEGAGRADVIVEGGEITTDLQSCEACAGVDKVVVTQCWDAAFISRYETTSPEVLQSILLPGLDEQGNANPSGDVEACAFDFADPSVAL